jgi:transposase-like protein
MDFAPPFCPFPACSNHQQPTTTFCIRYGYFASGVRAKRVQRFRCKACLHTFSEPTFRLDCGDRKPEVNPKLFEALTSGVGYRQSARNQKMGVSAIQRKARKLEAHAGFLHANLSRRLPAGRTYQLDEEETYEHASIRTLTMPVLIEREHWFVVATAVGSSRRLAAEGTERRAWQDREELANGPREDQSRKCVTEVMQALDDRLAGGDLVLETDQKGSYATIADEVFGKRVVHQTTSSKLPRTTFNPLFPINTTLAMTRDNLGRLRRQSWLVTKQGECLRGHMNLFLAYRNYVRKRFNRDKDGHSPGVRLGLLESNLTVAETLGWRQDWGPRSIHPQSRDGSRFVGMPALGKPVAISG